MLNRKNIFFIIIVLAFVVLGCFFINSNKETSNDKESVNTESISENNEKEVLHIEGDLMTYDYNEIKEKADLIMLVKCVDNLDYDNSIFYYDEGLLYGFAARRNIEVLEILKGEDRSCNSFLEPTAITKDGKELQLEDYTPMEKNGVYLVFLSNETADGSYSIISGNYGRYAAGENDVIDIKILSNNIFADIMYSALIDYYSDIEVSEKENILLYSKYPEEKIKCHMLDKDFFVLYKNEKLEIFD